MNYSVSVVIPMFNASSTIVRALNSVQGQLNIKFKEVIIIDDGSVDDSYYLVKKFSEKSTLKIIIIQQENKGVSAARNKGLSIATSDYVAFLDSDDEWLPHKTEQQMPLFNLPDVVLVGGYHTLYRKKSAYSYKNITLFDQFLKNHFQTSTVIVKRSIALSFGGFFHKQKYAEEGRFYFELFKFGKLMLLNKQVVIYDGGDKRGFGQSGLSKNLLEMQRGEISNFKYAKELYNISNAYFLFFYFYSYIKYIRRNLLVFFVPKIRR